MNHQYILNTITEEKLRKIKKKISKRWSLGHKGKTQPTEIMKSNMSGTVLETVQVMIIYVSILGSDRLSNLVVHNNE